LTLPQSVLYRLKRRTIEEMEQDLSREKVFDMTIQLRGISLLLPENGVADRYSSMIHIDLDSLILKSCLDDDKDDKNLLTEDAQQLRFYTKYKLRLYDLRITYAQSVHILRRIPLLDMNFYKCIYSDDAYLAE
jgi:hypothetical protein